MDTTATGLRHRLRTWWDRLAAEVTKFGVIGTIGLFVDNGAYLLLTVGWFGGAAGPLSGHEKVASVVATGIASLFSWVCNRYWTFRAKRTDDMRRELFLFAVFNGIGALITMACVALAIDVLHVNGAVWETTARVIGIVLGTLFRFWTYRRFVFVAELAGLPPEGDHLIGDDAESRRRRG